MGAADNLGEGREGGDEAEGIPLQALPVDLHLSCRMQLLIGGLQSKSHD